MIKITSEMIEGLESALSFVSVFESKLNTERPNEGRQSHIHECADNAEVYLRSLLQLTKNEMTDQENISLKEYKDSQTVDTRHSFATLIAAAMRKADTYNIEKLKSVFPGIHKDLQERYNAPGGMLPDELKKAQDKWDDELKKAHDKLDAENKGE